MILESCYNNQSVSYNRSLLLSMITGGTFIDKIKSMTVIIKVSFFINYMFLA